MRAELLKINWEEELRAFQSRRSRNRSAGRHLSEIVHRIIDQITPGRYPDDDPSPALFQQGFVWEDVLSRVFASQFGFATQIETELDDILMTLDGLRLRDLDGSRCKRVVEMKMSKMSAANPITSSKFDPWMIRTKGYCTGMDTDQAEIIVLFVNGSYEHPSKKFGKTVARAWKVWFSKQELKENWEWILRTRDEMDEEDRINRKESRNG